MEKQISELAKDIQEATRRGSAVLVEETSAYVKANHHYHSKNDFDKIHPKTLAELEAEYLIEIGYRKQVEAEWLCEAWDEKNQQWVEIHWRKHQDWGAYCSNCKGNALFDGAEFEVASKYCPHCGAKMKGN